MKSVKDYSKAIKQATKKYDKAMKRMGIDTSQFARYENAEEYSRSFKKTSINKHTSISLSSSL